MTPVQEFQKKHGANYAKIVASPAFQEAMLLLNVEKMKTVTALQPEEVRANGAEILGELIGHLKHEEALMTLHERRTFDATDLPPETYSSDEEPPIAETSSRRKRTKKD